MSSNAATFSRAMRHLWWRFWWADCWFAEPGLYFWAGHRRGNVRLWGVDFALQLGILALTLPGIWLAGGAAGEMRAGFVLLLASQPFWLAATWRARHFGAFAVAVLFTALWLRAVFNAL